MKIQCNLCTQDFEADDEFIEQRKKVHEEWHIRAKIQGRNTVDGVVTWLLK
jgi:hypothetical protein